MAKFVVVNKAPKTLEKGEVVIAQPDFMEQIVANAKKAPRNHQTAVNHLREILQSISVKYDQELNPMRIKLVNYIGLSYASNEELSAILVKILRNEYPTIFQKVLEHQLTSRPSHTKLVYYVGNSVDAYPFFKAGIDSIDAKDVEAYMNDGKPKKVGKLPAPTVPSVVTAAKTFIGTSDFDAEAKDEN
jgi:hypothetical protein